MNHNNHAVFCLLQYNIPVHYHVNNRDIFVAMIAVHYFQCRPALDQFIITASFI